MIVIRVKGSHLLRDALSRASKKFSQRLAQELEIMAKKEAKAATKKPSKKELKVAARAKKKEEKRVARIQKKIDRVQKKIDRFHSQKVKLEKKRDTGK